MLRLGVATIGWNHDKHSSSILSSHAKRRLADEYGAAQERGEVGKQSRHGGSVPAGNTAPATVSDLGLTRQQVHEARQIRNAEAVSPGIVRRTLDEQLAQGKEPTTVAVACTLVAFRGPWHVE